MSEDRFESKKKFDGPRVNEQIRVPEIRLVGDDGHAYGVVTMEQAKIIAREAGLDLVEVSPAAKPPVVKLIDYGKFKYQMQKKASEAKKKQTVVDIKEIKLRPTIDTHDLEVKMKKAYSFLDDGDKVKLLMQFRGRELAHKDIGLERFNSIIKQICEYGAEIDQPAKFMGSRIAVMLSPSAKKKK
ncbi:MAG: translation initiation factor IF-3 [Bacteriovoracaceae bacterium]|nr:translation initiation factor IF-3 [Bacteriovoracaceae bacterium]